MKIASYNNTIQHNNICLRNDYQNRNVKYNTQNIEQDNFANYPNIGVLSNYAQVSFGLNVEPFYAEYVKSKNNNINHFLKLITPDVKSSATKIITALKKDISTKMPMIKKFLDDINNGKISCPVERIKYNFISSEQNSYETSLNGKMYWWKYNWENNGDIKILSYTNPNGEDREETFIITQKGNNSYVIKDILPKKFGDIEVCMAEYDIKGENLSNCKMNSCTCSGDEPVSIQQITLRSDGKGYNVILESEDPNIDGKKICL